MGMHEASVRDVEVTFVIPCLNEEECIGAVIEEIHGAFAHSGVKYEVIVADNGSTDRSPQISLEHGARVVPVPVRGYGSAIQGGLAAAEGEICVMGDADGSYPFSDSMQIIQGIRDGADIVMGNRFQGGIDAGAMPWLHRYIGNPALSAMGRILFRVPVGDFHCGLRGFRTSKVRELKLSSPGMEFASEMLVRAQKAGFRIEEVPVRLRRDLRSRPPHLRTWRDGWRHLRFLLAHSPGWVFLLPAFVTAVVASLIAAMAFVGPLSTGSIEFSYRSSLVALSLAVVSCSAAWAFVIGRVLVGAPLRPIPFLTEMAASISVLVSLAGVILVWTQYQEWATSGFGDLPFGRSLFFAVLGCLLVALGGMSFFMSFLNGLVRSLR